MIAGHSGECGSKKPPNTVTAPRPRRTLRPIPRYLASSKPWKRAGATVSRPANRIALAPMTARETLRSETGTIARLWPCQGPEPSPQLVRRGAFSHDHDALEQSPGSRGALWIRRQLEVADEMRQGEHVDPDGRAECERPAVDAKDHDAQHAARVGHVPLDHQGESMPRRQRRLYDPQWSVIRVCHLDPVVHPFGAQRPDQVGGPEPGEHRRLQPGRAQRDPIAGVGPAVPIRDAERARGSNSAPTSRTLTSRTLPPSSTPVSMASRPPKATVEPGATLACSQSLTSCTAPAFRSSSGGRAWTAATTTNTAQLATNTIVAALTTAPLRRNQLPTRC